MTGDRRIEDTEHESHSSEKRCRLRFRDEIKEISSGMVTALMLGRQSGCDIGVSAKEVSRRHARIEYSNAGFALIDQSANGTYVKFDDGGRLHVTRDRIIIRGSGIISLGKPILKRESNLIYFWCDII